MNKRHLFELVSFCVAMACSLACNQTTRVPPTSISPQSPSSGVSDVCLLYQRDDALWLQVGQEPPQKMGWPDGKYSDAACPPESLLPLARVDLVETPTAGPPYVLKHLIPHKCLQHPNGQEVWFNTEQPLDYGRRYNSDLWRYDPSGNTVERILTDGQGGPFLRFSPDGQRLVMAGSSDIKVMNSDASGLRQLFQFPELSICSEVNVWVAPTWLPDSSGVIVLIPEGCLQSPGSWPFGLWWVPLKGQAVPIDEFSQEERKTFLDPSPGRRPLDNQRSVYWQDGALYLSQEGRPPLSLVSLAAPGDGYVAFLCPPR